MDPDRHCPLCPQLTNSGRKLFCCGFGTWSLQGPTLTLTLTLLRTGNLHQNLSLTHTLTLHFSRLVHAPHFSPRGRSRDRSRFGPGDVPGGNPNPSYGSLPMGTQFQRLKTPRAWDTEAVHADSAWNLEAHHVVSQAWLQLHERIPEASSTRGRSTCVGLADKDGS